MAVCSLKRAKHTFEHVMHVNNVFFSFKPPSLPVSSPFLRAFLLRTFFPIGWAFCSFWWHCCCCLRRLHLADGIMRWNEIHFKWSSFLFPLSLLLYILCKFFAMRLPFSKPAADFLSFVFFSVCFHSIVDMCESVCAWEQRSTRIRTAQQRKRVCFLRNV